MEQKETETQVTQVSTAAPTQVIRTTKVSTPPLQTSSPQQVYQTKKAIFRSYQIIWYILGLVEALLSFRFVLKMLGANSYSGFTNLIYSMSAPLTSPFNGIFSTTVASASAFEWSTIIAGVVYAVVTYGIVQLIQLIKPTNPQEVADAVDNQ